MKYVFVDESWEDYLYWQKTDKKKLKKINEILKDIARNPFSGIGKPEPLKYRPFQLKWLNWSFQSLSLSPSRSSRKMMPVTADERSRDLDSVDFVDSVIRGA